MSIHGNVKASKQCTYVPLCLPYPTYSTICAEVGACTVKTQCLHYSRVHPRSTIHRCAWPRAVQYKGVYWIGHITYNRYWAELRSYIPSVPPLPSPPLSPMGILVCAKGGGRPSVRETCTMESLSTEGNTRNQQTTVTYL